MEVSYDVDFCKICSDGFRLDLFSQENVGVCVYCFETPKCYRCWQFKNKSEFISGKGRQAKACYECRSKNAEAERIRKVAKLEEARTITENANLKVCVCCFYGKSPLAFKTLTKPDGSSYLSKTCADCLLKNYSTEYRNDQLLRSPERVKKREREKSRAYRANHAESEDYKKHIRQANASWRARNPEKIFAKKERDKSNVSTIFAKYQQRAKIQFIDFELTKECALSLFQSVCFYCGLKNQRDLCGIDRVDNSAGYLVNNCVSCCANCNYMKRDWEVSSFVSYAGHIAAFNGLKGKLCFKNLCQSNRLSFAEYRTASIVRDYVFNLSEDEFNQITGGNCYICGIENSSSHSNGIDRVDNTVGYEFGNCKPCCAKCNRMKRQMTLSQFLVHCERIHLHCTEKISPAESEFKIKKRVKKSV